LPLALAAVNQEMFVRVNQIPSNKAWLIMQPSSSGTKLTDEEQR
jgi:hypothetical protein